ncbi:adenosylmethionine--8-amino-7-oxononanoate transaminase [Coxiella burnetii]|uniref:Adenosylmethionine-8-amino-7-oxononanoate aminotransferase n=1 Tax=Coxiella burnetii (strain RSA 493 / Nine Mile phase I) TaxID=227377 RepID=Q83CU4_COXBU|nr:adenosylmethionine--8-amino-7-oxononanoate transaminase [Coxiella burnetii]NP_820015.1 adenosylmethionine-8-amino-7-oxononanoate aminotransferase [Coxiella burnetii RSA 493]AAO90529.1 adenosylmethionine-8-amino-7-oxononanoate aminotransferase [Coxiella burnetii RSA 493]ABX79136.1 adenosylmethionine-8-amino-7-oxononanoate transaminase [Coxiella burnetii RSA 331]ACJ18351.1 adenosylmethionine-8-amino-7-oxononanoate aminotransferase [Coxiella burnetii CbuG_Q212]AML49297.1 adenosylmethionine-8-a
MLENDMQRLDSQHVWHPCSQMKDYEQFKPLIIKKAYGSYIELSNGQKIIDAISSWWCKSLGHNHPKLKEALKQQLEKFEHVIFANTTNEIIVALSQQLAALLPGLNKVFYAGDGSCAVEIAMKMSLHSRIIQGNKKRKKFIALKNSYHGETVGALSVSDVGLYRAPYSTMLFEPYFIESIPYVLNTQAPEWNDCSAHWDTVERLFEPHAETATAILVEPIVQGASGMKIYSQDFLARLFQWAKNNHIHFIADEIMTGIGRTGKMLACEHAGIIPDFVCLSKGLTSGYLPFSAVLTSDEIYQLFYDDYQTGKAFLHSHTYSGNALAAAVALATLKVFSEEKICARAHKLGKFMLEKMTQVAQETGQLENVRGIGALVAADLIPQPGRLRLGYEVYQEAVKQGVLLRPIGNTLYWLPPLNIDFDLIEVLQKVTKNAIKILSLGF